MRVPFEWLKEYIEITVSPTEVAHKLTMIGLEVEAIEYIDDDPVFVVNVTPNRPDCLSIIGIARELSAAYNIPYRLPAHTFAAETEELDFNVDILDPDICNRYAGRIIRDVKICPSPDWLIKRLEKCDLRSINNVVDITNYVLLELGHPLHAFDLDKIKGHCIRVGTPEKVYGKDFPVKIKTLDGIDRKLSNDDLIIWDSERPIAIAGIMGGIETEVDESTRNVFIESAYFAPINIRRTSKRLGIRTESSYRFERGADIKMLKKALDRAAFLVSEIAGGRLHGKIDIYPRISKPIEIILRPQRVKEILGVEINLTEIINIMLRLGFEIYEYNGSIKVKPPTYRRDVKREIDIIEEISRIYGYDRIIAELPKATIGIINSESKIEGFKSDIREKIKQSFLKSGYTEVINYSFMGLEDIELMGIREDDLRRSLVKISNPLKIEHSYMRTTILPGLIKNMIHNVSHGNREFRLFEVSRIFINRDLKKTGLTQTLNINPVGQNSKLPIEQENIAALYYKEKTKSLYRDDIHDFYLVKGLIEAIFNDLGIHEYSFVRSTEPFLHPGQSADIYIMDSRVGYIGVLSPKFVDLIDLKARKPSIVVVEFNFDSLIPFTMQIPKYRHLPKYPFIERDTSIIVNAETEASSIIKLLRSYPSELIEDVRIFDVYHGKNIPEGKKSVTFNIRYMSTDRTLKDEEVDSLHNEIVSYILDKTKGEIRSF